MLVYYFFIKIVFFFSIVRVLVAYEPMHRHTLFLGILYTAAVAFLSYVFIQSMLPRFTMDRAWELAVADAIGVSRDKTWFIWLAETFLLSTVYFKLICKFEEGVVFWTLLLLGFLVVLF